MKDQLTLRVSTMNRSIRRQKMANWQLVKYRQKLRVCMNWVYRLQNYKSLYRILQLLQRSHLDNFLPKTLKLGWVAFHSITLQLKCLDFQFNQYKKLAPVLSCSAIGYAHDCVQQESFCYFKHYKILFLIFIFLFFNFFL